MPFSMKAASLDSNRPRAFWERFRSPAWKALAVGMIAPVLVLLFNGKEIYRVLRTAWAHHQIQSVEHLIEEENLPQAAPLMARAKRLAPNDPLVLKTSVKFLLAVQSPPAMIVPPLRQLVELRQAESIHLFQLGAAYIQLDRIHEARELMQHFEPDKKEGRYGLELKALLQRADGETRLAEQTLRRALALAPTDQEAKLRLAMLDYGNRFDELHQEARRSLWLVAQCGERVALAAIRILAADRALTLAEVERLRQLVGSHAKAGTRERLGVLAAQIRLQPDHTDRLIDVAMATHPELSGRDLAEFLPWLAAQKQYARMLTLVPYEKALQSREVFPLLAHALAEEGRWQDLHRLLTGGQPVPVARQRVQLWLAEAAVHLQPGDRMAPLKPLRFAIDGAMAQQDLATLKAASLVAERLGHYELVTKCLLHLIENQSEGLAEHGARLITNARRLGNTASVAEVTEKWMRRAPGNPNLRLQNAYFKLLRGVDMENVQSELADLTPGGSGRISLQQTLVRAFAAYRFGDLEQLRKALHGLDGDAQKLDPGQRAVLAGLIQASGADVEAYRLIERVPLQLLLPEERRFISAR
jgi:tetratricopeptide (TPR) repeat protein